MTVPSAPRGYAPPSKSTLWRTPPEVFDPLHREFHFALDACASDGAEVVDAHLTPEMGGLTFPWREAHPGAVWCNPPYGRGLDRWIAKAHSESIAGPEGPGVMTVLLIFASTDTAAWTRHVTCAAEVRLIVGRVRFLLPDGRRAGPATKGSAVVIFRPGENGPPKYGMWKP